MLCVAPVILVGIVITGCLLLFLGENLLLDLFGTDTLATITHSTEYTGDGMHGGDPCFKGHYSFKDHKGENHHGNFSGQCYDVYDLVDYWVKARGIHAPGTRLHVRYVRWFPAIHKIEFPNPETENSMINWASVPGRENDLYCQKAHGETQRSPARNWLRRQKVWAALKNQYAPPHVSDDFVRLRDDEVAFVLLLGWERGFYSHDAIILWADQEILIREKPEDWIIELSLSKSKHYEDIVTLLKGVANPGEETKERSRILLGVLGKCLRKGGCLPFYFACEQALDLSFSAELFEQETAELRELQRECNQLPNPLQEVPDLLIKRLQLFLGPYEKYR